MEKLQDAFAAADIVLPPSAMLQTGHLPRNSLESPNHHQMVNPRQRRLIEVLYVRDAVSRHELDSLIGAANTPDVVLQMRGNGWELPCERRNMLDRDGQPCSPGFYSLSAADRNFVKARKLREATRATETGRMN